MKYKLVSALLLMFAFLSEVIAEGIDESGYTYVKASLGFPWFMFFVFTVLVLIPFVLIVILAWRKKPEDDNQDQSDQM